MFSVKVKHRKLIQQILMACAVIGMLSLWILGIQRTTTLKITNVEVHIDNKEGIRDLITAKEIERMVDKDLPNDIRMQAIRSIDIEEVEQMLLGDTRIHKVEVYIDAKQSLNIDIVQRRPILRVMNRSGQQFYIDQQGTYVALSEYRAVRVPVVTGRVESLNPGKKIRKNTHLYTAFNIVNQLSEDPFLSALIEQIYFEKGNRILLIPKIGDEKIVLDHIDDLPNKLKNLKEFYKELAKINAWGKYDEIDISYRKQVIGRNPVTP